MLLASVVSSGNTAFKKKTMSKTLDTCVKQV